MPHLARPGAWVVNCAISPLVSLDNWIYQKNSGIGGSAAYHALCGRDSVQEELKAGVGWQDPAIIRETGLCVWYSGPHPAIGWKGDIRMLQGLMALYWTGKTHDTPSLTSLTRNYDLIEEAGKLCANAVLRANVNTLIAGINKSYEAQIQEGMDQLPAHGEAARKYCGSGFGGYGLFLFTNTTQRESFLASTPGAMAIEPYERPAKT